MSVIRFEGVTKTFGDFEAVKELDLEIETGECETGTEVQLSVRPEKIWIEDLEAGMTSVDGTIVERVYAGTTTQIIVEVGPGMRLMALEQNTARAKANDRWGIGDQVKLGWRPEHALVLR